MKTASLRLLSCLLVLVLLSGCSSAHRRTFVSFRLPEKCGNAVDVGAAQVTARGYADEKKAAEAFGFNVRQAGLLPVQLVVDNRQAGALLVDANQSFLIDADDEYWPVMPAADIVQRLGDSSEFDRISRGSAKGAALAGVTGALVGATIGTLAGHGAGEATLQGAVLGASAGTVLWGGAAMVDPKAEVAIAHDVYTKDISAGEIAPGLIAHGFLFFPGEAKSARTLMLRVLHPEDGRYETVQIYL